MIIKIAKISFLFILPLILIISCPNKLPIENNNKIEETRDENGHLEQINYYDNDTLYKTEFYEYLNKHDEESRLVKTVENGEITYEMEECWKVAYRLQNNTFKLGGELGYIYSTTQKFDEINKSDKTIYMTQSNDTSGCLYDIENMIYWFIQNKRNSFYLIPISNISYQIKSTSSPGTGNSNIFVLKTE